MKKIYFLLLLVGISIVVNAQQDTTAKLDLLRAPNSPGASLLGFATSEIERPSDVSAFMVSLQNSFSKSLSNYAVEFAPYWLLANKGDYTTAGLNERNLKSVFKQTFVLSFAIKNPDTSETNFNKLSSYGGVGFKFSLIRGNYDKKTENALKTIGDLQNELVSSRNSETVDWFESKELVKLREERKVIVISNAANFEQNAEYIRISEQISELEKALKKKLEFGLTKLNDIKEIASKLKLTRIGWSWDIAGGVSTEFRNKRFDNSKVHNTGLWTSFGYSGSKGSSFLGLVRYLYNPDRVFANNDSPNQINDLSTLDAGGRYVFQSKDSKFSFGFEAIYRSVLSSATTDKSSWRCVFNTDYSVWDNQKLTFSFGRNFDNSISKDGNLVAALTLLFGLGNRR
ncbi:MAG: hypothetical protein EOO47_16845 [Flavobacterium sp.]|nr:MAG: hypothetical protein EOO47_16845 [Flavobacterium sp.]